MFYFGPNPIRRQEGETFDIFYSFENILHSIREDETYRKYCISG